MAKGKYHEWLEPDNLIRLAGWARDGLTDEQIARNIGIARSTLSDWKKKRPSIAASLDTGKLAADTIVENALYRRACAGDVTACIFWLTNRQPDRWQNKREHTIAEGAAPVRIVDDVGSK